MCLQLELQCEQLQLKVKTLQLDWETDQKRCMSYFNQIMELEKERDQVGLPSLQQFLHFPPPLRFSCFYLFVCLLTRLCAVGTACSWSTLTVCWTRAVCVNALQSCRPTWSSSRGTWRERESATRSKGSRAATVCTV